MNLEKIANDNIIYRTIVGAQMYGLVTPNSDRDEVGVFIPPKDFVLGIHDVEQVEIRINPASSGVRNTKEDVDIVIYALPKFLKLLANNNPNIVELLFAPQNCVLSTSKWWQKILDNRDAFVCQKSYHTFSGYAFSQKKKIVTKKATYERYLGYMKEGWTPEQAMNMLPEPIGGRIDYYEKFGYDVKFASHLIRLFYEGLELLKEGELHLPLHKNNEVLAIKNGEVTMEEVLKLADKLNDRMDNMKDITTLPSKPDWDRINDLQIEILEGYWVENV